MEGTTRISSTWLDEPYHGTAINDVIMLAIVHCHFIPLDLSTISLPLASMFNHFCHSTPSVLSLSHVYIFSCSSFSPTLIAYIFLFFSFLIYIYNYFYYKLILLHYFLFCHSFSSSSSSPLLNRSFLYICWSSINCLTIHSLLVCFFFHSLTLSISQHLPSI